MKDWLKCSDLTYLNLHLLQYLQVVEVSQVEWSLRAESLVGRFTVATFDFREEAEVALSNLVEQISNSVIFRSDDLKWTVRR